MEVNEELKPQDGTEHEAEVAGAITPQPAEQLVEGQTGAEVAPQKPTPPAERTYTQEEWSKRESAKDRENAQLRQALEQQTLQHQIELEETKDQRAVENGDLTEEQASQKKQQRYQAVQQTIAREQENEIHRRAQAHTEEGLRILAAQEMAKDYGVDALELIKDKTLVSPVLMDAKAAKLAWDKTKAELRAAKEAPETFDSGLQGTTGPSLDKMSGEEKVLYALKHPQKTK